MAIVERRTNPKVLLDDILKIGDINVNGDDGFKFMIRLYGRFGAPRASLFQSLSKVEKSETPEQTFAEEYLRHVTGKVDVVNSEIITAVDAGVVKVSMGKYDGRFNTAHPSYEVKYDTGSGGPIKIEKSVESLIDALVQFDEKKLPRDAVEKSLQQICGEPENGPGKYWCKYALGGKPVIVWTSVEEADRLLSVRIRMRRD